MAKLSTTSVFGDLLVDGMIHGNVTGNLTGNASTATSATTATSAGKWTTARTITIGSKGKTVDGSGNVSWTLAEIGAAAASHGMHPTSKVISTGFDTAYRTQTKGNTSSGEFLTTIRNDTSGITNAPQYGSGLAWGRGDTHGYLYMNYSSAQLFVGAGNADKLNWIKQVSFSDHTHNYAAASHGTHVTWATAVPKANGTAAIGTVNRVAREDHVHPLQTSVSGNAGTATKLATARTLTIGSTGKTFDGSANVSWTLSEIGAAASSHNHTAVNRTMITTPIYNASTGILIDFNLNEKSGAMVILKLYGNSYSANPPIEAIYQFYDYAGGTFYNPTGSAISGQPITLKVYKVGGKIKAWFQQPQASCTFKLEVAYGNNSSTPNVTLSNAAEPTGATETITITPNRVYSAAYKPTPADIGAATSSHGTHVTYATAVPKVAGTAAVGTVNRVAREDHVHPLQTSVSGNAGTATKLATARTIQIGNKSNTFDGSANITYTLADIGALALTGGTLSGRLTADGKITLPTTGSSWISGMTPSNASIEIKTKQSTGSYHPILAVKTASEHVANIGGINNEFGFYGFKAGRTANATDWSFKVDAASGNWTMTGSLTSGGSIIPSNAITANLGSAAKPWNTTYADHFQVYGEASKQYGFLGAVTTGTTSATGETRLVLGNGTATGTASNSYGRIYMYGTSSGYTALTPGNNSTSNIILTLPSGGGTLARTSDSITGNAATATKLATARTITIGNKSNSFDGSANISYTLADIGAAATNHSHSAIVMNNCSNKDLNTIKTAGWYYGYTGMTNAPVQSISVLEVIVYSADWIVQRFTVINADGKTYERHYHSGTTWGAWKTLYDSKNKPTPADIGAAAASHGTHVTYATATPKAHGTAAVGTSSKVAREDHVHPLQASAATWTTARTLTVGNTGKSVNGSGNVSWSLDEIGAAKGQRKTATTAATAQWYRIAQTSASINNCLGQFEIRAAVSGKHSVTLLTAGTSYGVANGTFVQQLSHTQYSATGISKARIVYHTTYNGNYAYLEVYIPTATATEISVSLTEGFGWTLVAPNTVGSIPSGYSNKEITLVQAKIVSNVKGALDGNASSATKLATARNIKIGNATKSFNGTANVEFTLTEIGIGSSISAVASNLSGVTINGYDSMMTTINSNLGNL